MGWWTALKKKEKAMQTRVQKKLGKVRRDS